MLPSDDLECMRHLVTCIRGGKLNIANPVTVNLDSKLNLDMMKTNSHLVQKLSSARTDAHTVQTNCCLYLVGCVAQW